ncbi:fibropellin-1-like [Ruditapes philippinarum]|uniref:fibropellin-1-like n=1 Tax=Ruditapes philippinarum TaxID=129788 RepID=UPI00295B612F|nr:fibropellin-1-like [Ruditapes philippinarum]
MITDIDGENPLCPRASGTIPSMCFSECVKDEDCTSEHGDEAICCHGGCKKEDPDTKELNVTYMSCLPPDLCSTGVCKHGECIIDPSVGYRCICDAGYDGRNCTIDINECEPMPCLNGGKCVDLIGNYTCCCPAGFTGRNCEEVITQCGHIGTRQGPPCFKCKKYKNAMCITKVEYYIVTEEGKTINVTDECINP